MIDDAQHFQKNILNRKQDRVYQNVKIVPTRFDLPYTKRFEG